MTNSFTEQQLASRSMAPPNTGNPLSEERGAATSEGRKVLALEMIADQLGLIARHLGGLSPSPEPADRSFPRPVNDDRVVIGESDPEMDGIRRGSIETFAVGRYTYTNLELAIEEAKRARKRMAGWAGE